MRTLESIKRRRDNVQDLLSIVKTMKALAAVNIRQFEQTLESLGDYHRTVMLGIQAVLHDPELRSMPTQAPHDGGIGVIILGSDQGMCGQFNEQIAEYALVEAPKLAAPGHERVLLVLGARLLGHLGDEVQQAGGWSAVETMPISGTATGITPTVQEMLLRVDAWHNTHQVQAVWLFHNRPRVAAGFQPGMTRFLPVDLSQIRGLAQRVWPSRARPMHTMDGRELFSALVREYLFIVLYRAVVESMASENTSRLTTMQSAERNINEHLQSLDAQFHQQRQRTITEELLDIVAGMEAIR